MPGQRFFDTCLAEHVQNRLECANRPVLGIAGFGPGKLVAGVEGGQLVNAPVCAIKSLVWYTVIARNRESYFANSVRIFYTRAFLRKR